MSMSQLGASLRPWLPQAITSGPFRPNYGSVSTLTYSIVMKTARCGSDRGTLSVLSRHLVGCYLQYWQCVKIPSILPIVGEDRVRDGPTRSTKPFSKVCEGLPSTHKS